MQERLGGRGTRLAVAAAVVIVGGVAAVYATGAITRTTGTAIVGCVKAGTGDLRIVADPAECRANESVRKFQPAQEPESVTVDCAAGESIGQALAESVASSARLTITIKGTCTEAVGIFRDNVTLQGAAPGDGITAPASSQPVLPLTGRRIFLGQLTLTGGSQGIFAFNGAQFGANGLHVSGAANAGISVTGNAVGNISNSTVENTPRALSASGGVVNFSGGTIRDNVMGVSARSGGAVSLVNSLVEDSSFHGVTADPGGSIDLNNSVVRTSGNTGAFAFGGDIFITGAGSLIEGSTFSGVSASDGGSVHLSGGARSAGNNGGASTSNGGALLIQGGAIVENNTHVGVAIHGGSSLRMRGGVIVRGNGDHGIFVSDTGVATFGDATNQIVNNGRFGILCAGAPSVAMISGNPGTVTGNTQGQVNCPNSGP